jgi:hypothetical protein
MACIFNPMGKSVNAARVSVLINGDANCGFDWIQPVGIAVIQSV